jgi:hypothetical protein
MKEFFADEYRMFKIIARVREIVNNTLEEMFLEGLIHQKISKNSCWSECYHNTRCTKGIYFTSCWFPNVPRDIVTPFGLIKFDLPIKKEFYNDSMKKRLEYYSKRMSTKLQIRFDKEYSRSYILGVEGEEVPNRNFEDPPILNTDQSKNQYWKEAWENLCQNATYDFSSLHLLQPQDWAMIKHFYSNSQKTTIHDSNSQKTTTNTRTWKLRRYKLPPSKLRYVETYSE